MDAMSSISQLGLEGIETGFTRLRNAANDIARANKGTTNSASLVGSLVEVKAAQHQVEANIKVVKAEDELVGGLLDKLA